MFLMIPDIFSGLSYLVALSHSVSLGNLSYYEDINRAWENIKENIKTSAKESLGLHELKRHKLQWVQDPSQRNVDNLNNVRHEVRQETT
jgi:hypothetical protein